MRDKGTAAQRNSPGLEGQALAGALLDPEVLEQAASVGELDCDHHLFEGHLVSVDVTQQPVRKPPHRQVFERSVRQARAYTSLGSIERRPHAVAWRLHHRGPYALGENCRVGGKRSRHS